MISSKASNWVDRGEPAEPVVQRILSSYLHLDPAAAGDRLREYGQDVRGMVEADATEVQLAGYLSNLEKAHGIADRLARHRRSVAIALWHIVKAAEVRDRALRLLREHPEFTGSREELAEWLLRKLERAKPEAGNEP
jgi:hypothetical protein